MNTKTLAIVLLIPFTLLTAYAVLEVGYIGIFTSALANPGTWQVGVDLVIAMLLILCWLIPHAKAAGRNPIPYVLITLCAGSFGPLLYLALGKKEG